MGSFVFQKENGNTSTLLVIIVVKSLQKEQIAQITKYDPWSAGIYVQWPLSNSTPQVTNSMHHFSFSNFYKVAPIRITVVTIMSFCSNGIIFVYDLTKCHYIGLEGGF